MLYPYELQAPRVTAFALTYWSGQRDLNPRPPAPKAGALPDCAMPRHSIAARARRGKRDDTHRPNSGQCGADSTVIPLARR